MDQQEELVRLVALQVRLSLPSQNEAIRELRRVGFAPRRIAEILGTTQGTVNTALTQAKKRA